MDGVLPHLSIEFGPLGSNSRHSPGVGVGVPRLQLKHGRSPLLGVLLLDPYPFSMGLD
jgi:hypothetical protein